MRRRCSVLSLLLGASVGACASQGTGQPVDDAGAPSGGDDAGGGADGSSSSGSGSGSGSSSGTGAHDGATPDATADGGPAGSPDGGAEATGDGGDGGAIGFTCPAGPFAAPVLTGLTPTKVAGVPPSDAFNNTNNNFGIIEGPVWIGDSLYISEIGQDMSGQSPTPPPPSRILKVTTAGVVSVAIADAGSNGLAVDKNGNLYGAVHKDGSISRFDLGTGAATPVATGYMGIRFNSPNDLTIRNDGNIYFSDPDSQAPSPRPQALNRLYRVAAGTNAVSVVDATLSEPNGVTLSIDQNTLYVTSNGGLFKYPVMADGSVGASTLVTSSINGDGMAIDCAGDLYVASINSSNIIVLGPTGTQLGMISVPAGSVQSVTNAAFGGPDHKTLYITALGSGMQKALFQVTLTIPGMPY